MGTSFYPRSPRGERQFTTNVSNTFAWFLSALPHGERLPKWDHVRRPIRFRSTLP